MSETPPFPAAPLFESIARGPAGGRAFWLVPEPEVRIRLGIWPGPEDAKGTVFLLPGRTEYVEKYGPAAMDFERRGYAMLAVDWRGQGLATRPLADPMKGHVGRYAEYQRDLDAVIEAAGTLGLPQPWFVLGHSMGGAIGLRRITGAHRFAAAGFSAPMWGIKLPAPVAWVAPQLARALHDSPLSKCYPPGMDAQTYVLSAPFDDNKLTTDPEMWAFMVEQARTERALTLGGPTLHWVAEGLLECAELARLPAPDLPCYCALGGAERIVHIPSVTAQMARWPKGRIETFDGAEHEIMMEGPNTRARFYDACAATFDAARGA